MTQVDRGRRLFDRAGSALAAGRHRRAATLLREALAIFETECGPAHPDVANVLNALGRVHEYRGEYDAAERAYERSAAIMRTARGGEDVERSRPSTTPSPARRCSTWGTSSPLRMRDRPRPQPGSPAVRRPTSP